MGSTASRRLLVALALAVAAAALGWALAPSSAVERADEIAAPPATVYELLTDLRVERRWSPWRDAHAHYLFSGPPFGQGAAVEWSGRPRGAAEIVSATSYREIVERLTVRGAPRESRFRLTRSAQGTHIVWLVAPDSGADPLARWRAFLFRRTLRAELERGLDRLGDLAEALPHADMQAFAVRRGPDPPRRFAYLEGSATQSPEAVSRALVDASREVAAALGPAGLRAEGGPVWIAWQAGAPGKLTYRAGFALDATVGALPAGGRVRLGSLGGGVALIAEHQGGLNELPQAESAIRLFESIHQLTDAGPPVVAFSADPERTAPNMLTVRVSAPIRAGF